MKVYKIRRKGANTWFGGKVTGKVYAQIGHAKCAMTVLGEEVKRMKYHNPAYTMLGPGDYEIVEFDLVEVKS